MEVKYKSTCGRFEVTFDVRDQQTLFKELSNFQEVFCDDMSVEIDGLQVPMTDIRFRVRTVNGDEFFEKVYIGNNPKLFGYKKEYGCSKEHKGCMFPRVKDPDGTYRKNNGWYKWDGKKAEAKEVTEPNTPKDF